MFLKIPTKFILSLNVAVPIIFLVILWTPLLFHYHVPQSHITDKAIEIAKHNPADMLFDKIVPFFPLNRSDDYILSSSESILNGNFPIPGTKSKYLIFPFDKINLTMGSERWQLQFASFVIPRILLRAYEISKDIDFLSATEKMLLAWANYEKTARFPNGFLWNDHAISERIFVLSKFWRYYRKKSIYDLTSARVILEFTVRCANFLAKPSHFTSSSNHGIMQSLALLQTCITFPALTNVEDYKAIALERLSAQINYYLSDEGVVLEHSPFYHKHGIELLSQFFNYLSLLNIPISKDLQQKYDKAIVYYSNLIRPDGSLPMIGDTSNGKDLRGPHIFSPFEKNHQHLFYNSNYRPNKSFTIYPISGYSIFWHGLESWPSLDDDISQLVTTWSYFPWRAHKHADELSLTLWKNGVNWWTNSGYWNYGTQGRSFAVGWIGSNAPHLKGESTYSNRYSSLLYYGSTNKLNAIDLKRSSPGNFSVRRQIYQFKSFLFLIIDSVENADRSVLTNWTAFPNLTIKQSPLNEVFEISPDTSAKKLIKLVIGSPQPNITTFRGSKSPFIGWANNNPASSILIEQPKGNSCTVVVWLDDSFFPINKPINNLPTTMQWLTPEEWSLNLSLPLEEIKLYRKNQHFSIIGNNVLIDNSSLNLNKAADIRVEQEALKKLYYETDAKYKPKKYTVSTLLKGTYILIASFVLAIIFQIIVIILFNKFTRPISLSVNLSLSLIGLIVILRYL